MLKDGERGGIWDPLMRLKGGRLMRVEELREKTTTTTSVERILITLGLTKIKS